jgi:3-oxoacyl-[acyl-carrier protein] reductase
MDMAEFSGKVVLITGAGRGIGRELALAFACLGAAIAANDINPLSLDETVSLVQQAGGIAQAYIFDVAKRMPIEGLLAQVQDHFGHLDVLVTHAAVRPDVGLLEMDEWEFHRTLDVNLGGPFFTMQQAGRVMRAHGGGSILNLVTFPGGGQLKKGRSALSASLAGLLGLTLSAASELAAYHIRVNAVCCGKPIVPAALSDENNLPGFQDWCVSHPDLSIRTHPDVIRLACFLCSEQAETLTGEIFAVKGERVS